MTLIREFSVYPFRINYYMTELAFTNSMEETLEHWFERLCPIMQMNIHLRNWGVKELE